MSRHYGDFKSFGLSFSLLMMMVAGFVLGMLVIMADAIRDRFSKGQRREAAQKMAQSAKLMFAGMCSGPLILVLLDLLLPGSHGLVPVESIPLLLAVPASSVLLVSAAGILAWRGKQMMFVLGCTLLFIVYLYELSLIVNLPLPGMR